jgi:hypothetical protein
LARLAEKKKKGAADMGSQPDYVRQKFAPLLDKSLKNALATCLGREFPRIGGPRIRELCAQLVLDLIDAHHPPRERVTHGQVVWLAVPLEDPPHRHQRIADLALVPVVLDLSTEDDVQRRLDRCSAEERLLQKSLRLCRQAHAQGGLLSNCDLAELLAQADARIAALLAEHERTTGQLVPRRATLHDVGTALTHKRIICYKRYAEGKEPHLVAKETWHSLEAVDRYLGQYDRVRCCRLQGLTPEQTAHTLNCSVGLVREYLRIDDDLKPPTAPEDAT